MAEVSVDHFRSVVRSLSVDHYYIEYRGYLTNHSAHVASALFLLGDSKHHFDAYMNHYKKKLESVSGPTYQSQIGDEVNLDQLLGARKQYYTLYKHYKKQLQIELKGERDSFLREVMPKLITGSLTCALHPLIHTGYGYAMGDDDLLVEGVAYMHHNFIEFNINEDTLPGWDKFGRGTKSLLEVLADLAKDDWLFDHMLSRPRRPGFETKGFQSNMIALMEVEGNRLVKYVYDIKFPDGVNTPDEMMTWALDSAVTLYQGAASRNDFILIHGVTASWGLSTFFKTLTEEAKLKMIRALLCCLLGVYLTQNRPELISSQLTLENSDRIDKLSWKDIVDMALALPVETTDEHVFKLVQVCHGLAKNCSAGQVGDDALYKRACLTAIEKPMTLKALKPIVQKS